MVDRSDAADAERLRWLLDGHGYFLEEKGVCGSAPVDDDGKDHARRLIDAAIAETVSAVRDGLGVWLSSMLPEIPRKRVTFSVSTEWSVDLPADWDEAMCEFWANDGTWCVQNMWGEMADSDDCNCLSTVMRVKAFAAVPGDADA